MFILPSSVILSRFGFGGSSGGNDPDHRLRFPVTMTHDQQIRGKAVAENDKPFFIFGMLRIVDQQRVIIIEHRCSFLERNAVLLFIDGILIFIPFKTECLHNYIIIIRKLFVNCFFRTDDKKLPLNTQCH